MRVSVVIPLYNMERHVAQTIGTVLSQSFQDFEIVVVDDGSTDGSVRAVEAIRDPRIHLIRQLNGGAASARNAGIATARGEWITFLDSDDIWLPHNLASHFSILDRNPDISWSAGNFLIRRGRRTSREIPIPAALIQRMENGVAPEALEFLACGLFCTGTVLARKSIFKEIGVMDTALKTAEDLDLWLRIALQYPRFAYCPGPIAEYRDVPDSLSRRKISDPRSLGHFAFARKYLDISRGLPPERGDMVRTLCRKLIETGIKKLLLGGHAKESVKAIEEFTELIEPSTRCRLRLLAKVPDSILRPAFLTFQMRRSLP